MSIFETSHNEAIVLEKNKENLVREYTEMYTQWRREVHAFSSAVENKDFPLPDNNEQEGAQSEALVSKISKMTELLEKEGVDVQSLNDTIESQFN